MQLSSHVSATEGLEVADGIQVQISPDQGVLVQLDVQDFTFCLSPWGVMYIIEGNILRK